MNNPYDLPHVDPCFEGFRSHDGRTFGELSAAAPVLMVFLRHLRCVYCRRMLHDLSNARPALEERGLMIALVHMADEDVAEPVFAYYGLDDLPRFSDPDRTMYRAMGLTSLSLRRLLDPETLGRGWRLGRTQPAPEATTGLGGNVMQMPGIFLIDQGRIVAGNRILDLEQRPDFLTLADQTPHLAAIA
jgi:hypothetical protein